MKTLDGLGATMVAITPQKPELSRSMIERHGFGFDILGDPGNAYAARLGLEFELPAPLRDIYRGFGIDLAATNGEDSWTLPMPARLVIDHRGTVRSVDVDPDYTRRPEPQKTIEDVAALDP